MELTNKCNFQCTHCYKEAGQQNDCFIDTNLVCRAFQELKGKTHLVEFTGGEALLHPDFEKIVECAEFAALGLITNGSLLNRVSIETLKKFQTIQVSFYGDCEEEYRKRAKSNSFLQVSRNIKQLIDHGVWVNVAIVLRKSNYRKLDNYINILDELGVRSIRFGLTNKSGRNASAHSDWDLSFDECCEFDIHL